MRGLEQTPSGPATATGLCIPLRHWLTAEPRVCLEVYRRSYKNFFISYVNKSQGLDLENTLVVAIWLPNYLKISDVHLYNINLILTFMHE